MLKGLKKESKKRKKKVTNLGIKKIKKEILVWLRIKCGSAQVSPSGRGLLPD